MDTRKQTWGNILRNRLLQLDLLPLAYDREIRDLVFFLNLSTGALSSILMNIYPLLNMVAHVAAPLLSTCFEYPSVPLQRFRPPTSTVLSNSGT